MSGHPRDVAKTLVKLPTRTRGMTPGVVPAAVHQGVVISIQGTTTPPTLTITALGDPAQIPGITYWSSYQPHVGDTVILERTGDTWVVRAAIAPVYVPRCELSRVAGFTIGAGAFDGVPFDTLVDGPASIALATGGATTAGFKIPAAGRYSFSGRLSITTAAIADRLLACMMVNNAEVRRGNDGQAAAAVQVLGVSVHVSSYRFALNDLVQLGYFASQGRALNVGGDSAYAILEYLGP